VNNYFCGAAAAAAGATVPAMTGANNARPSAQDRRHEKCNVAKPQVSSTFSPIAEVARQHRAPRKFFRTATRRSVSRDRRAARGGGAYTQN